MHTSPTATAARFPAEYGQTAETTSQLLDWNAVADRIAAARNYWLATITDDDRPYLRPVDGVFVDSTLAFGGSPATRWVRHLQQRPAVTVSLPDDDHAVVLEGDVDLVTDDQLPIAALVGAANVSKYPQYFADGAEFLPFWALRPRRVFAWSLTGFPNRATRFDFEPHPRTTEAATGSTAPARRRALPSDNPTPPTTTTSTPPSDIASTTSSPNDTNPDTRRARPRRSGM
jgi:general stress protein 26